jgi:hypothetical protein
MTDAIYTGHLNILMEETYAKINTDLMIVIQSLIGENVLHNSDLEKRIKSQLEKNIGWNFDVSDVGNVTNKLSELGVLWRYKREGEHQLAADFLNQTLYVYSMPEHVSKDQRVIALAALRVFGDSEASITELTQRRKSISAIKLLTAMFPHSMLDMGPHDFLQNRENYDPDKYCPIFNELLLKTGLREKTLRTQLEKLESHGLINKVSAARQYKVMKDFTTYKPRSKFGATNRAMVKMAKDGFLSVGNTFTFKELYDRFDKKPDQKMLRKKLHNFVDMGYLTVSKEKDLTYWVLNGKGQRVGLYFVLPLQRHLMGVTGFNFLQDEAKYLTSHSSEITRDVTNVLARYAKVSGYIGRKVKKK